jgi:hypothetical protein
MCGLTNLKRKNCGAVWMKNDPAPPNVTVIILNLKVYVKGLCKVLSRKINFHRIFIKLFVVKINAKTTK